ncbi:conserved hypothetical protein [Paenibacillus curdlanolyticus YK9]|uniref:CbiN domain protein n=1 Tax=Paenibacillus curdlanolyticus YK9 TaxID=717606 RepID=E0I689_9BACL|nr:hypothetical protein [Paenibacillus curdlanolyticus]EFM12481.1 conserved hypothetical protein [Paenibacillus curdlanolyticus YK9]
MPKSLLRWNGIAILLVLGVTMLLSPILLPSHAYACSCAVAPSVADEYANQTAVFAGEVTAIKIDDQSAEVKSSMDPVEVTFQVQQVWKGDAVAEQTVVKTVREGASCGYPFQEAQAYLVYASGEGTEFQVGLCSGTKPLASAGTDIQELNGLKQPEKPIASPTNLKLDSVAPQKETSEPAQRYFEPSGLWVTVIVLAVGAVTFILWRNRRRRGE